MQRIGKAIVTLALAMVLCTAPGWSGMISAQAASYVTFDQLNADSVFLKQSQPHVCTLTSNAMMIRRAAMLSGDKNWQSVTESSVRSDGWVEGAGMKYNYSSAGFTVAKATLGSSSQLAAMLKSHPEGIVIYNTSRPHAILVTDYTDGVFYCSDPSNGSPSGRYPVAQASITVASASRIWYVTNASDLSVLPTEVDRGNLHYTLVSASRHTVSCSGFSQDADSKAEVKVPATIKIDGVNYNVVSVAKKAFKNETRIESLSIGENVSAIGNQAFYGCKNLKEVMVSTSALSNVGESAFKGISEDAVFALKDELMAEYQELFGDAAVDTDQTAVVADKAE